MQIEQLEQLQLLSKEIEMLEAQIKSISKTLTSDTVMGSDTNFPYVYRPISIVGVDMVKYGNEAREIRATLTSMKGKAIELVCEIVDFMGTVDDSEMRQIMTLRYVEGYTWQQVANRLDYADESTPRKKMNKYIKDNIGN